MPKAKDPMALFADLFKELPVDTAALETAYKSVAELNEKLAASAIKAASAAQEVSETWTKGALLQAGQLTSPDLMQAGRQRFLARSRDQKRKTSFPQIISDCYIK